MLAPLLAFALFRQDADPPALAVWLAYMVVATIIRTWKANRLEVDPARIVDPFANLRTTTWCVGLVGVGWGLGWVLVAPSLDIVNRMIYLYVTTGAMFSGMFGFGVYWPAFYALALPIFLPAIASVFWPNHGFPWPFAVGLVTLFIYALRISRKFSSSYQDSLRLRLRNESLYEALAAERDASVAANLAKSRFIASASHDLRQPMHAVNFYLESLDMGAIPAAMRNLIGKIRNSVSNLNQMFESLLDVSKLDAFSHQPVQESFRLQDLMAAVEEVGAPLAANQGIAFTVRGPDAWLLGDEKLLRQVLLNLVTNAIYYTPSGSVSVSFIERDGRLVAEVADTGCGIRAEDQALIFTEFFRVSETRSRHDGLGLGLSIVKRVCDLIEAHIEVDSQVGRGSTFRVTTGYRLSADPPVAAPAPQAVAGEPVSLAGLQVGVVDDDANIVEAYRQALMQRGARVVVLSEYPDLLQQQLAELDTLDLIISDFRLEHTSGHVVIQQLRENFNRDIPAIIVTADTSPAHISYFKALNVPVLHKPVTFQQVLETAERVLGNHRPPAA